MVPNRPASCTLLTPRIGVPRIEHFQAALHSPECYILWEPARPSMRTRLLPLAIVAVFALLFFIYAGVVICFGGLIFAGIRIPVAHPHFLPCCPGTVADEGALGQYQCWTQHKVCYRDSSSGLPVSAAPALSKPSSLICKGQRRRQRPCICDRAESNLPGLRETVCLPCDLHV